MAPNVNIGNVKCSKDSRDESKSKGEEHRLVTTKDQVNKMLGEYNNLSFISPPDPKSKVCNAIDNFLTTKNCFDWPNDLIDCIKQVMAPPLQHTISSRIQVQTLGRDNKAKLGGVRKA